MATTVLIVDDHPSFRASARALLEAEGYEVVGEAEDATSAVEVVRRLRPDVVMLDVQLPDGNGFDVCSQLMADGEGPRIVLVSSRDRDDYGTAVDDCGACGFVSKCELSGPALAALLP
jgi:DNA-binding NarL/FixJ family response regulator